MVRYTYLFIYISKNNTYKNILVVIYHMKMIVLTENKKLITQIRYADGFINFDKLKIQFCT